MKKITLILLFVTQILTKAQVPNLLKDITAGSASSKFGEFTTLPNTSILFFAKSSSLAPTTDAWLSDGSTAGTQLLRTYNSTSISVLYKDGTNFSSFVDYNSKKYFVANIGASGIALWGTDGTAGGTDSLPLPGLSKVTNINIVNGVMIIEGQKSSFTDQELWRSDGSIAGTYSLGAFTGFNTYTYTIVNNVGYFKADNGTSGYELYRTDGTVGGTYLIKDIKPGLGGGLFGGHLFGFNNEVFFTADDGSTGFELWKTDGSPGGASLFKDINPGSGQSLIQNIKIANNGFYFIADDQIHGRELWFSDGTTGGTCLLKDVSPGTASAVPGSILLNGNEAYYIYNGGAIYKTDGTVAGTDSLHVSDYPVQTSSTSTSHYINDELHLYNNELYFTMVRRDNSYTPSSVDTLSFNKVDLNLNFRTVLAKIKHDKSLGGTYYQYNLSSNYVFGPHFIYSINSSDLSNNSNIMIFNPQTNQHRIFYKMGVNYLQNTSTYKPKHFPPIGNKIYMTYVQQDMEPGYLDLSNDSIYLLKDINPAGTSHTCSAISTTHWNNYLYPLNNKYYFLANEPGYGLEFFETDFTPAGTFRVKDIYPGNNDFDGNFNIYNCLFGTYTITITPYNIFFLANDGVNGLELWSFINASHPPVGLTAETDTQTETILFPNPTSKKLTINSNTAILQIKIMNTLGCSLIEINANGIHRSIEISVEDLPEGVYLARIKTVKGVITKKFIKE